MRISSLLHRAFPVLTLLFLASSASLVARGLFHFAGSALTGGIARLVHSDSSRGVASALPAEASSHATEIRRALESNPASLPEARGPDLLAAPDCEAIAVHIVSESKDRAWSLASLRVAGEPGPRLCRIGDEVAGQRVEFIGYNPRQATAAVWLSSANRLCQAAVAARPNLPDTRTVTVSAAAAEFDAAPEIAANVQRLSDTEFNLSRPAFDRLFENALHLGSHLRVVPEMKDGRTVGVRVFGVRPGTWLSALGLKNGDRVESINGFDCTKPEALLEAYARLRTTDEIDVKLTRGGAKAQLAVHVR
jgi:general secretion pathway protein C